MGGLRGAGRPRRPEPKAKRVWIGQHGEEEIDAMLAALTPAERWQVWQVARQEKERYGTLTRITRLATSTYEEEAMIYAGKRDLGDYDHYEDREYVDIEDIIDVAGQLPVRVVESAAASPCFTRDIVEFGHSCDAKSATWSAVFGQLQVAVILWLAPDDWGDVQWSLCLISMLTGEVVTSYSKASGWPSDIITCPLEGLVASLQMAENVKISDDSIRRAQEVNYAASRTVSG